MASLAIDEKVIGLFETLAAFVAVYVFDVSVAWVIVGAGLLGAAVQLLARKEEDA